MGAKQLGSRIFTFPFSVPNLRLGLGLGFSSLGGGTFAFTIEQVYARMRATLQRRAARLNSKPMVITHRHENRGTKTRPSITLLLACAGMLGNALVPRTEFTFPGTPWRKNSHVPAWYLST
jgi:hypothetical protein